ncbi:MAG: hypothetical protein ACTSRP_21740, partial [Candidatus Helarchaeota archaeon]
LRPDYIILDKEGKAIILDAKYRDLSEKVLPSKWLYQLSMYALSNSKSLQSIILYPTSNINAKDSKILINIPKFNKMTKKAYVIIRPIVWKFINKLIQKRTNPEIKRLSINFAKSLISFNPIEDFYEKNRNIIFI